MNLDTNKIIEKRFQPVPDYAELGMIQFIEHSEEVMELTDERLVETGKYFKEMIPEIEAKQKMQFILYDIKRRFLILFSDLLQYFHNFVCFQNLTIRNNFAVDNKGRRGHHAICGNL